MTDQPAVIVFNKQIDPILYFISREDLASTISGKGASLVGVNDADGYYTGSNVEAILKELNEGHIFPIAKFGTLTDYTQFKENGTLQMVGNATTWEDLNGSALEFKSQGSGVSISNTENTLVFTSSANLSDYGYSNFQLRHAWKIGTVINPHFHREQASNNVPNFLIRYRRQIQGGAKTTDWTDLPITSNAFTYVSGTLNQISYNSSGITPPTGAGLSDVVEFRIFRDTTNASGQFSGNDTYSGNVGITYVDIHIEEDTLGSNLEYTK